MADPFVGEIRTFGFNFPPRGWAQCNGQLLPISQNTALFALLGTYYGGDGKSTFALPNLQGASPMDQGQGSGLSERYIGEMGGAGQVTLLQSEMPTHPHLISGSARPATENDPNNFYWGAAVQGMYLDPLATVSRTTTCNLTWCSTSASRCRESSPRGPNRPHLERRL
jgi:microcystin-dependent protein